ncbi:MAG: hypothetical protein F4209_08510 [Chloroflexi bacterium]|nr:hypothetical protein [Chloroflexota bacterium]
MTEAQDSDNAVARISARPLSDGRIEFALQVQELRCSDSSGEEDALGEDSLAADDCTAFGTVWGERILPRGRNFPAEPEVGTWLSSRPPVLVGEVETRIRARRLDNGNTEFAIQQRLDGENWGDNIPPSSRFIFPSHRTTHIDRWLNSSTVTISKVIVIPVVEVPAGVPIVAEATLAWAELDGWTYNGSEPSFYYGVRQDPLDDSYDTWVVKVAKTDDDLYDTLRLQVSCYGGSFEVVFWEEGLPYQSSDRRVRVSYRFDDGEVTTGNWNHYSGSEDGFYPADFETFSESMKSSDKLVVRATFYSQTVTATFTGVSQMFRTRVQPNIEYCGHY